MNDESHKMSRRDWFRLRVAKKTHLLASESGSGDSSVGASQAPDDSSQRLQPIADPPNHDGLDLNTLPPMREALLSKQEVAGLFADIAELGSDVMLMQRKSVRGQADAAKVTTAGQLDWARDALLNQSIQRVQIRYQWQGSLWIDTMKNQPDGIHIVRIAHQTS